jgi:hypothetical protein
MLAATAIGVWAPPPPDNLRLFDKNLRGVTLFGSNIHLMGGAGYFARGAGNAPAAAHLIAGGGGAVLHPLPAASVLGSGPINKISIRR